MDLELTDEQRWLSESVEALLTRDWPAAERPLPPRCRARARWAALAEFGVLAVGGDEGLGAVELCLIARALGAHLASVPYLGSAALRYAIEPFAAGPAGGSARSPRRRPRAGAARAGRRLGRRRRPHGRRSLRSSDGAKVAVEHAAHVEQLAVVARGRRRCRPGARPRARRPASRWSASRRSTPASRCPRSPSRTSRSTDSTAGRPVARPATAVGALLAAAEAVGAAGRAAGGRARLRRRAPQFGRTIGSYPGAASHHGRHVRHGRRARWSSVLYAAAALDDDAERGQRRRRRSPRPTSSRAAREVAHGAMQVFGGIAFTQEHPAHRYLRRIVVREQQFGDALHHERDARPQARCRARSSAPSVPAGRRRGAGQLTRKEAAMGTAPSAGFNDPTAQRLEPSPPARIRTWSGPCWPTCSTIRAG